MNTRYILLFLIFVGFTACNEIEDVLEDNNIDTSAQVLPDLTAGSADFSNYVAVGASFTAGFTDGALFKASQENSFANMLAKEFSKIGGGTFNQPLMNDNIGGFLFGGNPSSTFEPRFFFDGAGPARLPATPTTEAFATLTGPFQNIGVPGAKSFHMIFEGYGNPAGLATVPATANPYFVRMASSPTASMIGDAAAQNPTFFTLSLMGGNDVIDYAFWGGGNSTFVTDSATFDFAFTTAVNALTAGGAKGVVTNVPYIEDLPHFTTVPYNPVPLNGSVAAALNQGYAAYNGGIQQALAALGGLGLFTEEEAQKRTIAFQAGQNAVVIEDESLTDLGAINPAFAALPKYRQATAEDIIVLSASTFIGTEAIPGNPLSTNGVAVPLGDRWVLTPEEQQEIKDATDGYNSTIESAVAANPNLALVDLKELLLQLSTTGISTNNFTLTTDLVTGGAIGLDGIHLTSRGYGLLANEFLKAIDAKFGSNFIESGNSINVGDYPTNYSPALQ